MRPGHRRTQSANFIATLPEQQPIKQNGRAKGSKSSIPQLLTQCQLNAHHKICNVDSLHAQIKDEDKMFNFGKGLSKLELRPKSRRDQPLDQKSCRKDLQQLQVQLPVVDRVPHQLQKMLLSQCQPPWVRCL